MRASLRLFLPLFVALVALGALAGPALAAPANDNFADAAELTGNRGAQDFDLTDASTEVSEPQAGSPTDRTIWFRYAPTADGFANFSTCEPDDAQAIEGSTLAVYTGTALTALTTGDESTGDCPNGRYNAGVWRFAVQANQVYWIQVGSDESAANSSGKLSFDFNGAAPNNDDFADAAELDSEIPQTFTADNGLATTETDEPASGDWGPRQSLWYHWIPDATGTVSIDTCSTVADGNNIDSEIFFYSDDNEPADLAGLNSVASNDDACPAPNSLLSHLYAPVVADTGYWIRLVNYQADFGSAYKLKLRWVGEPELARPPAIYPDSPRLRVGDTAYAAYGPWGADPAVSQTDVQWRRCDSAGENCADIADATAENYAVQAADLNHRLVVNVTASNGVDSVTAGSSPSGLVEDAPANDDLADATNLGSTSPVSAPDDNYFASTEDGESDATAIDVNSSVWYRWTAPVSKTYLIDTCGPTGTVGLALAVYTANGPALTDLTSVASETGGCGDGDGGASTNFAASAGTTYVIEVGSSGISDQADFTLRIALAPAPSFTTQPTLSGTPIEAGELALEIGAWDSKLPSTHTIAWSLCDSAGNDCAATAETSGTFAINSAAIGKRAKATVTATNVNGSTSASILSGVIAAIPSGGGGSGGGGGGGTSPPPVPANPLVLKVKKSLGALTPKKGVITIKGAVVTCGASATGPCTGTITFNVKKGSSSKKYIDYPIWIPPNSSRAITVKLKSAQLKALKKAKSVKTSVAISVSAPGFAATKATSTATLKPQK